MAANSKTAPATAPKPSTWKTYTDDWCLEGLGEPGLRTCAEQDQTICPGQGNELKYATSVDTARPGSNLVEGTPYCTADLAGAAPPAPAVPAQDPLPEVTLADAAELLAPTPQIRTDHDGQGMRHAETNFHTSDEPIQELHDLNGTLVELRLTPVRFTWDHGDGTTTTTTTGGHPEPEFDVPTPTSHVYTETGTYQVNLTTTYVGHIRVPGGAWQEVPGTITRTAAPVTAEIWTTNTRNVAEDCTGRPAAWGCSGPVDAPGGG